MVLERCPVVGNPHFPTLQLLLLLHLLLVALEWIFHLCPFGHWGQSCCHHMLKTRKGALKSVKNSNIPVLGSHFPQRDRSGHSKTTSDNAAGNRKSRCLRKATADKCQLFNPTKSPMSATVQWILLCCCCCVGNRLSS